MLRPLASDDPREVGPYTLAGRLGTAGRVYLGHTAAGAAAAVTMARPGGGPDFADRFDRALEAAGDHLRGWDPKAEHPWLAVTYGPSLHEVVDGRGALPVPEVLGLTAGIADALAALHDAGLAHGALNADTVLPEGPRLVGFGPDAGEPAADVRELGTLIAYLTTGRTGAPVEEVPEPLGALARRCAASDPAARPSPAEIAEFCRARSDPLAYVGTEPPANPLDLSTGIPPDAIVGPVPASPAEPAVGDPLAYPATDPPENPLDLSAGIPGDAIVGPIPADAVPDEPEPLTYPATAPPANPLDLSTGIPGDAIVGPITPEPDATDPVDSPAYAAAKPPANPLDLSTGIPGDVIVGPIPADIAEEPEPLTYAAANPPANPLDLSAGIPGDAIVGPISADIAPDEPEPLTSPAANPLDLSTGIPVRPIKAPEADLAPNPLDMSTRLPTDVVGASAAVPDSPQVSVPDLVASIAADTMAGLGEDTAVATAEPQTAVTAPPIDPHDLAALRAAADAVAAATAGATAEPGPAESVTGGSHVLEPVDYAAEGRSRPAPPVHDRRRRLVGLAAAILLAAAVIVPLVHRNTIAGTPVADERATPAGAGETADTTAPACDGVKHLAGSGSALQRNAVTAIALQWAARCGGSTLDYISAGTALGVQQFATGETDLAVADHVLGANQGEIAAAAARCAGIGAPANKDLVVQVPIVLTPMVLAYNLAGIDELRLDPPAVSAILGGRIVKWNDRTLAALNPGTRLPATAITVVARADEALSTQTVQQYLTAAGGWRSGDGPEFTGKAASEQRSDTDVLAAVRAIAGAIGYLPYPLTSPTQEPIVTLVVGDGKAARPDADAVDAAVDGALRDTDDYTRLPDALFHASVSQSGDATVPYPLVHVGYIVACAEYPDDRTAAAVRDFLLTALGMRAETASGYQLPSGELRVRLVDLVRRTY